MRRWLILAILVVVAFGLGYMLSRPLGTKGTPKPTASFLIHVYGAGTSCTAVVAPKRGDALEEAGVRWDIRNDCAGQTVSSFDVSNFRRKGNVACEQDTTTGDPNDSPVGPLASGEGNSKHGNVKKGAAHGQHALAYCYDVTVTLGNGTIKADPEIDIMQ